MKDIKVISIDNIHCSIVAFITEGTHIIGEYEDMKEVILLMIKCGYMFNMDRDRLRDAMEDITYMMCPDDDINKDRVSRGLEYEDDEDDSDYGDYNDEKDGCKECSDKVEDIGNTSEM